ncbi:unnamed protein product [Ectocarpus sp. CCAP 1310/34]|nr:unnamed protein product [Ectocarpus sp. CCAP 1310/34]
MNTIVVSTPNAAHRKKNTFACSKISSRSSLLHLQTRRFPHCAPSRRLPDFFDLLSRLRCSLRDTLLRLGLHCFSFFPLPGPAGKPFGRGFRARAAAVAAGWMRHDFRCAAESRSAHRSGFCNAPCDGCFGVCSNVCSTSLHSMLDSSDDSAESPAYPPKMSPSDAELHASRHTSTCSMASCPNQLQSSSPSSPPPSTSNTTAPSSNCTALLSVSEEVGAKVLPGGGGGVGAHI